MINQSETSAKEWLKKTYGYTDKDLYHKVSESPDFICSDGKKFEVKRLNGRTIIFSDKQSRTLTSDVTILVFNNTECISSFLWGEREKSQIKIIISNPRKEIILISRDLRKKLILQKIEGNFKTIGDVINSNYERVNMQKETGN